MVYRAWNEWDAANVQCSAIIRGRSGRLHTTDAERSTWSQSCKGAGTDIGTGTEAQTRLALDPAKTLHGRVRFRHGPPTTTTITNTTTYPCSQVGMHNLLLSQSRFVGLDRVVTDHKDYFFDYLL